MAKAPIMGLVVWVSLAATVAAETRYVLTDIAASGADRTEAYDINNDGAVVGYYVTGGIGTAFRFADGVVEDVSLSAYSSTAAGINSAGQVVGELTYEGESVTHGFIWSEGSGTQDLGGNLHADAINDHGAVVGYDRSTGSAFLWQNGTATDLGIPAGSLCSWSRDINDSGLVVGELSGGTSNSFVWESGSMTPFNGGAAYGINEKDEAVGGSTLLRRVAGDWSMTAFPGDGIMASDINEASEVVGRIGTSSNADSRAFIWTETRGTEDLNLMIDPLLGWTLTDARGINDCGQIVGWGLDPYGEQHAFLLTPIPEPATLSLLAIGWLALLRRRSAQVPRRRSAQVLRRGSLRV